MLARDSIALYVIVGFLDDVSPNEKVLRPHLKRGFHSREREDSRVVLLLEGLPNQDEISYPSGNRRDKFMPLRTLVQNDMQTISPRI